MTETEKCSRCRVDVPKEKPTKPFIRCADWRCPLHTKEENEKLKAEAERARG